jgi:15-cis-phytoene desaturase
MYLTPSLYITPTYHPPQDELSVIEYMEKYGMPDRINQEIFQPMAKALDFIEPGKHYLMIRCVKCMQ